MEIEWNVYVNKKPTKEGLYLWAENNWNTRDLKGQRVFSGSVRTAYWSCRGFRDGSHGLIDPDMWAEVPKPAKAERPLDDLAYEI